MQVRGRDNGYVGPLRTGHKASTGGQLDSASCSVAPWRGHACWSWLPSCVMTLHHPSTDPYLHSLCFPHFLRFQG